MSAAPILLIEDSLPDAMLATSALNAAGAGEVEHCSTLCAALERLADPQRSPPSAVLLDLTLPDSCGVETYDRLSEVDLPPVIILSADEDPARALALIERGVQDYLVKGQITPPAIVRAVGQAIERGRLLERERAQSERSAEALRIQSAFIAAMSHEIRTPLSAILGMSDLLSRTELKLEQREYVEISRSCGRALQVLLDNLLEMARLEGGPLQLAHAPFSFDALVDECMAVFSNAAHQKGIALFSDLSPEVLGEAVGDEGRLRQILFNLVGNAVKFTSAGRIIVRAHAGEAGTLVIEVADTGIGIAPDRQQAVFDRFVQADPDTTRRFGGSGLGLALCRDLATAMGGQIRLESEPGVGSVFRCELPLQIEPRPATASLAELRILTVLTDPVEREVVAAQLRQQGAWVFASETIRDAERESERRHFDVVLADLRQSTDSALDFFERLRARDTAPRCVAWVPVNHRSGDLSACQTLGVLPLRKPAGVEVLKRALRDGALSPQVSDDVPTPRFEGKRVLVVDDAPEMRKIAEVHLGSTGCATAMAFDGEQAIAKAASKTFDVILMDSQMPGVDGLEATRRIRASEVEQGRAPTPIVALTADSLPAQKDEFYAAGCNAFLAKPFSRAELFKVLGRFLTPRRRDSEP